MTTNPTRSKNYARVLTLLLGLFALRVVAQLLVLNIDVPLLPSFDEPVVAHQTVSRRATPIAIDPADCAAKDGGRRNQEIPLGLLR